MPLKVVELFGHAPDSPLMGEAARSAHCPFLDDFCRKHFSYGMPSGLCTASQTIDPVSSLDPHPLRFGNSFTTTLDQLYLAFAAPKNMPPKDAYSKVVADAVKQRIG